MGGWVKGLSAWHRWVGQGGGCVVGVGGSRVGCVAQVGGSRG